MSRTQKRVFLPALVVAAITFCSLIFVVAHSNSMAGSVSGSAQPRSESAANVARDPSASDIANNLTPAAPQNSSGLKHGPVQLLRFTLYDAGIYPRQARVDKGLVAITLEDLSGRAAGLVIARDNGDRSQIGAVMRFEHHWRGRSEIMVMPGTYIVYDSSRPSNRARLVVEP